MLIAYWERRDSIDRWLAPVDAAVRRNLKGGHLRQACDIQIARVGWLKHSLTVLPRRLMHTLVHTLLPNARGVMKLTGVSTVTALGICHS